MTPPDDYRPGSPLPKSGWWANAPRAVIVLGALVTAALVVLVVIVVIGSGSDADNAGGDSDGAKVTLPGTTTEETPSFTPEIFSAEFSGWTNKKTGEIVTPPQRIKITGSLDLTETVESIGYGPAEQSMPKIAKTAATESSFPGNRQASLLATDDGSLRLMWACATMREKPDGANCKNRYDIVVDVSGSAPVVKSSVADSTSTDSEAKDALDVEFQNMAMADPSTLPASVLGTDKSTGAATATVLHAVQPRKSSAKVYFIVSDSLKLYVGELESNR